MTRNGAFSKAIALFNKKYPNKEIVRVVILESDEGQGKTYHALFRIDYNNPGDYVEHSVELDFGA